jgi:hypothetical protein
MVVNATTKTKTVRIRGFKAESPNCRAANQRRRNGQNFFGLLQRLGGNQRADDGLLPTVAMVYFGTHGRELAFAGSPRWLGVPSIQLSISRSSQDRPHLPRGIVPGITAIPHTRNVVIAADFACSFSKLEW